jgi:hypothetical protein
MKLSDKTKSILKNFSQINNSIYFRGGSTIATISVTKNIFAKATVSEEFPMPFAIYDLAQFLNGISLFEDPEIEFDNSSYLYIKSGRSKVKYFFADPDVIVSPPEKEIDIPKYEFEFDLSSEVLDSLIRSASVYGLPDLCLESGGGEVYLVTKDKDNETSNTVSYSVGQSEISFSFNFKVENIKIIPGNYKVEVTKKAAHFVCGDLEYYIALEPDSTYGVG